MAHHHAASFYQPLISSPDRLIRAPLHGWRRDLLKLFKRAISRPDIDLASVGIALNQLALLEAHQGQFANAIQLCSAQIHFWKRTAEQTGQSRHLSAVIQPWINIARLERWQDKIESSVSLYHELAPENRAKPGALNARYDIAPSLHGLCELEQGDANANVLKNVYWLECARLLLNSARHDELQRHLQRGLSSEVGSFIRISLAEILLLYQLKIGKHQAALALLGKMGIAASGAYFLHFKVMEMYLHIQSESGQAVSLTAEVYRSALALGAAAADPQGVHLLFDIARVFRDLHMYDKEIALLTMVDDIAGRMQEEVLQFEAVHRLAVLEHLPACTPLEKFRYSSYSVIRKKLGLPAPQDGASSLSCGILRAADLLAKLNYTACLDILDGSLTGIGE